MTWAPYDRTSSINKTFIKKETEFFEFVQKNIPDFLKLFFPNIKTTMIGLSPELFINYFCNNTDRKFRRYFKEGYSESIKLIDFCSTLQDDFLKESEKKFNKKFDNLSFDFFDHLFDLCIIDFSGRVYENPSLANTLGIKRRGSIINLLFKEWYD